MTEETIEHKNEKLALLTQRIHDAFNEAEAYAKANNLEWFVEMGDSCYQRLDSWEADMLGLEEGDYAWVSSSTFC